MTAPTLKRVCPLTGRDSPTKILNYSRHPWVLRQCLESGFVYLENPPDYAHFKEEFAWEVTSQKESETRKAAEPVLYAASTAVKKVRGRLLKRNKILSLSLPLISRSSEQHSGPIRVVDIGCGWGDLLLQIVSQTPAPIQSRCVPFGIELSNELARISSEKLAQCGGEKCVNDTAINGVTAFGPDFFDLIVMSSFLEHEINPLPLLRLCSIRLRPGGSIIIKVPNYGCINRWVRGARWCGFRWPDHVNYFTPRTLRAFGQLAGLKVARMKFIDRHPLSDNMYAVLCKPK